MFGIRAQPQRFSGDVDRLCAALQAVVKRPIRRSAFAELEHDESGAGSYAPDLAVYPESVAEVAEVMKVAARFSAPVTPRGLGSGKSGGALCVCGGIALVMTEMRRIKEIARADNYAVCEPGVVLAELQRAVLEEQRYYPPDPASAEWCSVGGTIAENAAGPRAFRYGTTRDYVLGMTVVLASGEIVNVGRRTHKGVAGYDLTSLLCGSEGTLAVIADVTLRLVPRPLRTETALFSFASVAAAAQAVSRLVDAGVWPSTLELLDPMALDTARTTGMIDPMARACLILEIDGDGDLLVALDHAAAVAKPDGSTIAADEAQRRRIWDVRKRVSLALKERFAHKVSEDICVPPSRMAELISRVERIAAEEELAHATYGHAGDGNLHTNYLWNGETDWARVDRALRATYEAAVALGGTITGEHGVGLVKREFLSIEQAPPVIALQRRLKATFDPQGILNPGKLFPFERDALLGSM